MAPPGKRQNFGVFPRFDQGSLTLIQYESFSERRRDALPELASARSRSKTVCSRFSLPRQKPGPSLW